MVPKPGSGYFQSLDEYLSGDQLVLSWKVVYSAITSDDTDDYDGSSVVEIFLSDPEVIERLSSPLKTFPEPSTQTRSAFDQRTSAINVTPSADSRHDIKEIKGDSLWLSQIASIDEVSALRIVVGECQSRATAQLQGPLSEEETPSIREALGTCNYLSAIPSSLISQSADSAELMTVFHSEASRRRRILSTYLSERCYAIKCVEVLLNASDAFAFSKTEDEGANAFSWLRSPATALEQKIGPKDAFLIGLFKSIRANVKNIEVGCVELGGESDRESLELEWMRSQITEATHAMEIVFALVDSFKNLTSSQVILEWLRLLQTCGFFNSLEVGDVSIQNLLLPLQSLTTIISLSIFKLGACIAHLSDLDAELQVSSTASPDGPFILDGRTMSEIHAMLLNAAEVCICTAGPAILAWSTILRAIGIRILESKASQLEHHSQNYSDFTEPSNSDVILQPEPFEDVMEQIMDSSEEDPVDFLALKAVNDCRVFETLAGIAVHLGRTCDSFFTPTLGARMRMVILDMIRNTTTIGYIPEVLDTALSALSGGESYWDLVDGSNIPSICEPALMFLDDEELMGCLFRNAMSRYPFESIPFLKLVKALINCSQSYSSGQSPAPLEVLKALPSFTYQLPYDFAGYETIQEEDNNNNVQLTTSFQIFSPRLGSFLNHSRSVSLVETDIDEDFSIPAGTPGRIISDSGPKIAIWFHEFSGLKYFGNLLETFLAASNQVETTTGMPADGEVVVEIIDIFSSLILSISRSMGKSEDSKAEALQILEIASSGLDRNRDIIAVIFDIFEQELQRDPVLPKTDNTLGVLVSCIHFIHALLPISPQRVWPLLAQSGLLGLSRGVARLPAIVENLELVCGQYSFLVSCCRLYEALCDDVTVNTVRRRGETRVNARFATGEDFGTGIPDQLISKILLSFTKYLVDALESSASWKFIVLDDRRRLTSHIVNTFNRILNYSYGVKSPSNGASQSSICTLELAASHIVESFLSTKSSGLWFQPLLWSLFDGVETPSVTNLPALLELRTTHVSATLSFSRTLLRITTLLEKPASQFESQIFRTAPIIARVYAAHDAYRKPVILLLEALISSVSNRAAEPPSLLGFLGPTITNNFIHMLSELDKPLSRESRTLVIWRFLAIVVKSRQQWFANFLLTGKTPIDGLQSKAASRSPATAGTSLLTIALEKLIRIKDISQKEALGVLEFVALAQNFWPWTVYNSQQHGDTIHAISEFMGWLPPIQPSVGIDGALVACYQTRIAAYIAEILAMHLFHSRQTGTAADIGTLIPNIDYFARFSVSVPPYNSSLHKNLKRNLEAHYAGFDLTNLKRTSLDDCHYGNAYFYDLHLADKMLHLSHGPTGKKAKGFRNELELANVNLSLVDSQIALFRSWKFLAVELSCQSSSFAELPKMLSKTINDCLTANSRNQVPEEMFASLYLERTDFALILAQRLVESKSSISDTELLINTIWGNVRSLRGSFEGSLQSREIEYHRSLLKLLFLSLRVYANGATPDLKENLGASLRINQSATLIPILLNILKHIVAQGLREFVASVHDSGSDTLPEDLALLTGILQAVLRIPGIDLYYSQIVSLFSAQSTTRVAVTLFSWSDSLAVNGDPIYGELSMLFLLELSSIPAMAEELALTGILGHIASANITTYLRQRGVSPFADSAGLQRCYNIWVKGILPLLLNLLDSVQASIASEVAIFLLQFPILLNQASDAFESPETSRLITKHQTKYITLSTCSEVHSLALIMYILNSFRQGIEGTADIPVITCWESSVVGENVEFWLGSKALLRERLVPMGEQETEWSRRKCSDGTMSLLEEKAVGELLSARDLLNMRE